MRNFSHQSRNVTEPMALPVFRGFGNALAGKSGVVGSSIHRSMNPATSMLSSGMNGFPGFPSFNGQSSMMNPMAGMFQKLGMGMFGNPMGGGGFNSLTGPSGIGTGVLPNSNQPVPTSGKSCDPAPYTCSLPPPWCQRTIDNNGCVVCMCGEALQTYLQELETGKTTDPPRTSTNSHVSSTTPTTGTTTHYQTTTSCLQSFFCTKTCANGYMTDGSGCPLCRCIETGSPGIVTTRPPNQEAEVPWGIRMSKVRKGRDKTSKHQQEQDKNRQHVKHGNTKISEYPSTMRTQDKKIKMQEQYTELFK